jgi:Putative adhesin
METFGYWKTMNKHMKQFSSISARLALATIAAVILGTGTERAFGQGQTQTGGDRIPVTLSDPSRPARIKAGLINGGITVKAYEGKEVVVEARARNRESSRSEGGPKRLAIPLTTGLSVEEENNEVNVNTDSYMHPIDLAISVPVHTSLKLSAVNDGDIVVTGVDGELDVDDVNGSVTLNNVSGSAVAHALNGHLHATFTRVDPQKAMAFSSLNGDIDVTFPADLKANVSIRSDRGDVFSDFDVQLRAAASQPEVEESRGHGGKYRVKIDKTVHGTINGGGPEIQFTNFQGQIYIRKAGNPR